MTFESKDSTTPPRFVRPTQTPPFRSLSLQLKQCAIQSLDPTAQRGFTLFSSFARTWDQNRGRRARDAEELLVSLSPTGREYQVRSDTQPDRRFSGDGSLSRSRYFAVCREDGLDGGTTRRELTAYHDPMSDGPIEIRDLAEDPPQPGDHTSRADASPSGGAPGMLVSIPPYSATRHDWLHKAVERWETTVLVLPVRTTWESFRRVVDLREPSTAAWFTHELTRLHWITGDGSDAAAFPNKEALDDFAYLLPSLLAQFHGGGNGATRIAGQWLRSLGADALVFPSARSDSWVQIVGESVKDFHGWNLVDYRAATPPRLQTFDLTPAWLTKVSNEIDELPLAHQADVLLERQNRGPSRGSWSCRNLEEANLAARLLGSALYLYEWARNGVTEEQRREVGQLLGATDRAHSLAETSAWFIQALLGDESIRRALVETIAETTTRAQARLIGLEETFRLMDTRLTVGRSGRRTKGD